MSSPQPIRVRYMVSRNGALSLDQHQHSSLATVSMFWAFALFLYSLTSYRLPISEKVVDIACVGVRRLV